MTGAEGPPLLYGELSSWWPLLSRPEEYAEEAAYYTAALKEHAEGTVRTVLELGSGGGNNASHMKSDFDLTLVDLSPGMLEVSRDLNPECAHEIGDMRTVRLDRLFDGVFVHDAICYATTLDELTAVLRTAAEHCRPGGAAVFAPDYVRETFRPSTDHGGHDDGPRGLRYLEWSWDPDPSDSTYVVDYAYLLRESDGTVAVRHDRHTEGLFARQEWMQCLEAVGFRSTCLTYEHPDVPYELTVFAGRKGG